jgi:hypothetical protein
MTRVRHREWISLEVASKILCISPAAITRLVKKGLIGKRELPGSFPLVNRLDVERIAEQSTQKATRGLSDLPKGA